MASPVLDGALSAMSHIFSSITFLALCGLTLLYITSVAIYRLYFHPLAKYPGPLFGRLTQAYDVYHAYRGSKHINFLHLHEKYGTVVRYSPNSLSINDSAALKAIYGHGANVQKAPGFYFGFRAAPTAISTLLATEKAHHARKRRIMGQAFSDHAMRGLEEYVLENVNVFMSRIETGVEIAKARGVRWSEKMDMGKWNNYLVFDIMGDLVFGKSFGTLGEKPENRHAIHLLGRAARRNYTVAAMPALYRTGLEKYIPPFRGLWKDRAKYLAFGKGQVMQRMADKSFGETGRKDIFSYLLTAKDPESGVRMPKGELFMEGNTLIVAGSDTSSTTLSATLFYLLQNPSCLQRLTKEIRETFSHEDEIQMGTKMQSCAYLRACIDEAMRMSPAVPGLLPRLILPGGLHIPALDLSLPAGIDVGVCTYAIHHHKDYVAEPFAYTPERWLAPRKASTGVEIHRSDSGISLSEAPQELKPAEALHSVFAPFSLGNRACLGKPLVYMELSIALARLAYRHDMRIVPTESGDRGVRRDVKMGRRKEGEYHVRDWFLSANEGPVVEFAARE